jgi:phage tail sheath gpL-like
MSARRTASSIATFAALAVMSLGAPAGHAASASVTTSGNTTTLVIVIFGKAYTVKVTSSEKSLKLSGILQTGGAG